MYTEIKIKMSIMNNFMLMLNVSKSCSTASRKVDLTDCGSRSVGVSC